MNQTERYCPTCGASNPAETEKCFACGATLDNTGDHLDEEASAAHILQNRYRLLSQVGSGGFSAVYKAEDLQTQRLVAVKAVSLRGLSSQEKIEATDAFNREVNMLTNLHHRNLPQIHDQFTDPECWYLVMDFIDGISLERYIEQQGPNRLPLGEVLDLGLLLCEVLDYLHSQQPPIIFRDLKPGNIMLTTSGHLFLVDFGIARRFKPGQAHDTIPFGSPGYAAPEQYGKAQTTPRADIYSLGAILHQLLSGEDPSHNAFQFASLAEQAPEMDRLDQLISSMVEMDLEKRPESIREVEQELEEISQQERSKGGYQGLGPQNMKTGTPSIQYPAPVLSIPSPFSPASPPAGFIPPLGWQQMQAGQAQHFQAQATALTLPNNYATASLVSSLIGIFLPPLLCFASTSLTRFPFSIPPSQLVLILFLVLPSLLGIVFGHIGKRRALTIPGMQGSIDTADTGMTIGYIFGSLYFLLALCILVSNLSPV